MVAGNILHSEAEKNYKHDTITERFCNLNGCHVPCFDKNSYCVKQNQSSKCIFSGTTKGFKYAASGLWCTERVRIEQLGLIINYQITINGSILLTFMKEHVFVI